MSKERTTINKEERKVSSKLAVAIKSARQGKKLSLQDLEQLTGISASYVNRLEKFERKNPTITVLVTLANALNLNVWHLLKLALSEEGYSTDLDIVELFLHSDFSIEGITVKSPVIRKQLMDIVSLIVYSFDENVSYKEIPQLFDMISRFHKEKEEFLKQQGA